MSRILVLSQRMAPAAVICGVLFVSASILDVTLPLQVSQHSSAPRG
jgi:hypothetical protein